MDQILKMGKQLIKSKGSGRAAGPNNNQYHQQQPQYNDDTYGNGGYNELNYDRPLASSSLPPSYNHGSNAYPTNYYPNTHQTNKPVTTSIIKTFRDSKGRITENGL